MNFSDVFYNSIVASTLSTKAGDDDDFPKPSKTLSYVACGCSILFALVGSTGNIITIIALLRWRRLWNETTSFISCLAVADLILCGVNMPIIAVRYASQKWDLGEELCGIFPYIFYGDMGASVFFMAAIAFSRFILVSYRHMHDKIFNWVTTPLFIFFCGGFSLMLLTATLFERWGKFGYKKSSFSCTILTSEGGVSPKTFFYVFGFLIPAVAIITSYSCIFYKVRKVGKELSGKKLETDDAKSDSGSHGRLFSENRKEMQVTRAMFITACSFLFCFLPSVVVALFEQKIRYPEAHILASILAWASACVKPIIYAAVDSNYRHAYVRLFFPKRAKRERELRGSFSLEDYFGAPTDRMRPVRAEESMF